MTTTTTALKLTAARRRALETMARVHPAPAAESNKTAIITVEGFPDRPPKGLVYWQTGGWLFDKYLVAVSFPGGRRSFTLTEAGLAACREAGITIGAAA